MTKHLEMNRRQFVVTTAVVGGGMAIGAVRSGGALAAAGDIEFDPLLAINADDTVVVRVATGNVGTSVHTSIAQFVCEELSCDWGKVRGEWFDPNKNQQLGGKYSSHFGNARTSHAKREEFLQAGASARERLKAAAAKRWNVPVTEVQTKDSKVVHTASNRSFRFGEVAAEAAAIKLDKEPAIKKPDQYTLVGRSQPRLESKGMVNGSVVYGLDVQIPGMLYAAIKHSPITSEEGNTLKSFNAAAIQNMPGVRGVYALGQPGTDKTSKATRTTKIRESVVVVADHYWQAKMALDAMPVEWTGGVAQQLSATSSDTFRKEFTDKATKTSGVEAKNVGDALGALKGASKVIEATYEVPYLDHALMEPLSTTARVTADRVDVWGSAKNPNSALIVAAEEAGMDPKKTYVNQMETFVGGDFGRRKDEEIREGVAIAVKMPGRAIKMIWSREEMTRQGNYRPMSVSHFKAGIGPDGMPIAWYNHEVSHSQSLEDNPETFAKTKLDNGALNGLVNGFEYAIPNWRVEYTGLVTHIQTGNYRGPGHNQGPGKREGFLDEVAFAGGKDPVELRRTLLRNAKDPGWLKVLNEVASKSNWGKPLPKGRAQGIAIGHRSDTIIANVAEVSVSNGGELKVHTVDVAFDVGNVMNPNGILNQIQGGTMYGLSDALFQEITVRNGRVVEGNFDDYPMLRIADAPEVKVHFGGLTGGEKLTPIGEHGNMVVGAAVLNAIFRATGKRYRSFPVRNHDLSWS